MIDMFSRTVRLLNRILLLSGAVILCLMMALATCNMVLGFLGHPIKGSYEAAGFMGALAACLALAPTQQVRGHITVDLFDRFILGKARQVINLISQILMACFFFLIIRQLVLLGLSLKLFGELSESLRIPFYPLIFVLALGFGALVLTLLTQMLTRERV
ncbi:MAG: TRAP transporter small permease subunit [Desulfonatronovibrio sp.]